MKRKPPATRSPGHSSSTAAQSALVQRTRDAGLTDADLLQLVTECGFASLVGLVDNLAGRVELDEFLRPGALT